MLFIVAMPMSNASPDPGNVAVINDIIENNGLTGYAKDDISNWNFVIWDTNDEYIVELDLSNKSLTGNLDLTGLTSLQYLGCYNNELTTLDLTGLTSLQELYCYDNQLTTLDLTGLTSLYWLYCYDNQLTTLDLTGLTSLQELYCNDNQLTTLDVTGLTNLITLDCRNNPLRTLQLPDNPGLSVWADPLLKRSSGSGTGSATIVDSNRIIPQTPAQNTNQPQEQTQNEVQQNVPQNQPEQQEQTQPPTSNEEQKENNNSLILMIGLAALIVLGVAGFVIYQRNKK